MEKSGLHRITASVQEWLHYHVVARKLATPFGIAMLGFISVFITYITVLVDVKLSTGLVATVGIILLCLLCIVYPYFGFYTSFIVSMFLMMPGRLSNAAGMLPTGLIPEYLSYLTLLGVLTRQQYRKEITSKFWSYPVALWMLILLAYLLLEIGNPAASSKLGWFNYFRKQVSFVAFFYISYCFFNSKKAIYFFTRFWIVLTTVEALYACKQQWFGFFDFEYLWLISDQKRFELFVNFGFVRRFGLLSDPASAGILYSCSTVMLLIFALRAKTMAKQIGFFLLTALHFMASSYTGTRTGTMMVVAGVIFYIVLNLYERRTLIFSGVFAFMIAGLLFAPIYNNQIINRLRTAFEGSKDPSNMARDLNRAIVQPYAYKHPIGGGLNTCGNMGQLYNPGHFLSMIPPDSGFMQTMMEQGPIGLALLLIFYYVVLRTGIKYYYRVRDPEIRTQYAAHMVSIFTLMVAQYSQLAIGQYPSVLYFYAVLAILLKLHQYDSHKKERTHSHETSREKFSL